jgi:hypothetical protein
MAIKSVSVAVPADGSVVPIQDSDAQSVYGDQVSFRNTGLVTVMLGGPDRQDYPLFVNEAYTADIAPGDVMYVRTLGTAAGQIAALKTK